MSLFGRKVDEDELLKAGWTPPVEDGKPDSPSAMNCPHCNSFEFSCWLRVLGGGKGELEVSCSDCGKREAQGRLPDGKTYITVELTRSIDGIPTVGRRRARPDV